MILLIKNVICFILDHKIDWSEYDNRIEKEEHYAAADIGFCIRCKKYKKI